MEDVKEALTVLITISLRIINYLRLYFACAKWHLSICCHV